MVTVSAWAQHAEALRDWVMERIVNRDDARGGYWGKDVNRTTRKKGEPYWSDTPGALLRHFRAKSPEDICGFHSVSLDNTCRWLAFDIDAHTDKDDPDINFKAAIEIANRLEDYKLTGHIFGSNGVGGFHVWVFFESPIPAHQTREFGVKISSGIDCEVFPKQYDIKERFGNWLRIPGKHHTTDYWSQYWTGAGWADDVGTVDAILRIEGESTAKIPQTEAPAMTPVTTGPVPVDGAYGGARLPLRNETMRILVEGTDSGNRNNALAQAAIEMCGNGWSKADTEMVIVVAASRCRPPLESDEARSIVNSAFSRRREPWVDTKLPEQLKPTPELPSVSAPKHKPLVSNILTAKDGKEGETKTYARSIDEITEDVAAYLNDWPRRVSGLLFAIESSRDPIPPHDSVRIIRKQEQLFAWLQANANVHWPATIRKGVWSRSGGDPVSAVTRTEFYEHLAVRAHPSYRAVELLPHHPPFADTYYVPCNLPSANGDCLNEFVERLNADSDLDRALMLAALATPGWGGESGQRPAFLFQSEHGRGSGKSKTAERIMQIWGGWVSLKPDKEDWAEAKSRLMDALSIRCVYIDNIKNKLSGAELESLITTPVIDAKKMYVGHFTRPNRLTFFLTANTPRLSNDLTERSIPIYVGKPRWGENFDQWAERFIADNRPQLIADILGWLGSDPVCNINTGNRDRWWCWQDVILSRMADGDKIARAIIDRRPEGDADLEAAEGVRTAIEGHLETIRGYDAARTYRMSGACLLRILQNAKAIEAKMGVSGMASWVGGMLGTHGAIPRLGKQRLADGRGWVYTPTTGRDTLPVVEVDIPSDTSDGRVSPTSHHTWGYKS